MTGTFRIVFCVLATLASGCVAGMPPAHRAARPDQVFFVFDQPGAVRYLPGYNVYYVPDASREIYVVDDIWYYRTERLWYQSRSIDGPWVRIELTNVPPPVLDLPPGYRDPKTPHEDIPWSDWSKGRRRRTPEPRLPERPPPRDDRADRHEDWRDRGEGRGPGVDLPDRRAEDRPGNQVPPALVVPPGMGAGGPARRPEPTLPPVRMGRLQYLNRHIWSGVYYIPEVEQEIFLYGENWYRRQDGAWYRAPTPDGRWSLERDESVPSVLRNLSPRYRAESMERVPYPPEGSPQAPEPRRPPAPPPVVVPPSPPPTPQGPLPGKGPQPPAAADETLFRRKTAPEGVSMPPQQPVPSRPSLPPAQEEKVRETEPPAPPRSEPPSRPETRAGRPQDTEKSRQDRLPKMDIPRPDRLYRIASSGVSYLPSGPEVFLFQGAWYTRSGDAWYNSRSYEGPWTIVPDRDLPKTLRELPPDYRSQPFEEVPFDTPGKGRKER